MSRPKIAVTMGDPAGIGPEIIIKMFLREKVYDKADVFVIGDLFPLLNAQRIVSDKIAVHPVLKSKLKNKTSKLRNKKIKPLRTKNVINLLDMGNPGMDSIMPGAVSKKAGRASYNYIREAIGLAVKGEVDGIVTAPINKHAMHLAGVKHPGHTEILAKFSRTKDYAMMLAGGGLRVVLVTVHTALKNVPALINKEKIYSKIKLAHNALKKDFGIKKPRVAVLGLNPHAGENGAFGNEEIKYIAPAVKKAVKEKINAGGPYPPDTVFNRIVKGREFDAAVCMYHDQGLIPLKLYAFETGVNVTLGLPFVRTSPDHGTAYDLAGTGRASERSIIHAFKAAVEIAKKRKKKK